MKRIVLIAALSLAGCADIPPTASAPVTPRSRGEKRGAPEYTLTKDDLGRIAADVSAARQLTVDHPIAIEILPREAFLAEFRSVEAGADRRAADARDDAFSTAFALLPRDGGGAPKTSEVLESQLLGFYDVRRDKVFVPHVSEKTPEKLMSDVAVLAHEVEHAIVAQHFKHLREPRSSDEAIAMLALIEGDAQVAMGAFLGKEAGAPVGRTLRRIVDATKDVPVAALAHGDGGVADRALERTKARLDFPYTDGMMFVADLYRAGGYDFVNAAFSDPPLSSEHVLHPEKYLAGDEPRAVRKLPLPAGYEQILTDSLGELDTRVLLERCLDKVTSEAAANGWGGDRYAIVSGPSGEIGTVWVSAWDTERDAKEMESALEKSDGCWANGRADRTTPLVVRRGDVVVFVRGVAESAANAALPGFFASVDRLARSKARSSAKLPPRVELLPPEPGHVHGDVYENEWLGIVGRIPPGLSAEIGQDDLDLAVSRPGSLVYGGITISTRIANEEQNERTFADAQRGFAANLEGRGLALASQGTTEIDTPLGRGIERTWTIPGTAGALRMILVPICASTGSIVFIEGYGDPHARKVLDGWTQSFRLTSGRNLRACDYLDPK